MFCEISDHNRGVIVDWTKLMSDISSNQDHQLTYTPLCVYILVNWFIWIRNSFYCWDLLVGDLK